jgi:hypothetical protein
MEQTIQSGATGFLEALRNAVRSLARFLRVATIGAQPVSAKEQDRMTDDGAPSRA